MRTTIHTLILKLHIFQYKMREGRRDEQQVPTIFDLTFIITRYQTFRAIEYHESARKKFLA